MLSPFIILTFITEIIGKIWNSDHVVCQIPNLMLGTYIVQLSLENQTMASNSTLFYVDGPLNITRIYPTRVPL